MELTERPTEVGVLSGLGFLVTLVLGLWDGATTAPLAAVPQALAVFAGVNALANLLPGVLPASAALLGVVACLLAFYGLLALITGRSATVIASRELGPLVADHPVVVALAVGALVVFAWAEERRRRDAGEARHVAVDALVAVTLALVAAAAMPRRLR